MNVVDKRYLKVLNASAGSGKTYNLVKDYIKILLSEEENTKKFAHILAMTFTNMAALEMKQRIVSALFLLSTARKEDKTKGLLQKLEEETGKKKENIIQNSTQILTNILHNYEQFSVMTIDKFNLRLIRSFAKELNLPIDFKVELDHKDYVKKVIELMLSKIGEPGYERMTKLVLEFAQEQLEDDSKWNFQGELETLAGQLEKEHYQKFFELILTQNFEADEKALLKARIRQLEKQYESLLDEVQLAIEPGREYKGKSNFTKAIEKVQEGYNIYSEGKPKAFQPVIEDPTTPLNLVEALNKFISFADENNEEYAFLLKYVEGFSNMALIKELIEEINKYKNFEKIVQISEFNKMISGLIRDESSPFIYEKLGNRFNHFLLDEFQDTSELQWSNVIPLLHESASNGNFSLIVGDPKQSIYRFRNSNPKQFVNLLKSYQEADTTSLHKNYPFDKLGKNEDLKDNWRSAKEIVHFNNKLFEQMKLSLPPEHVEYYNSTSQDAQSKKIGLVDILIGEKDPKDSEEIQEQRILEIIDECVSDGFKKSDICLLFQKNKVAVEWSEYLTKKGHEIVSAESLLLINSRKVRIAKLYLELRQKPEDINLKQQFVLMYIQLFEDDFFEKFTQFQIKIKDERTVVDFDRFVSHFFGSQEAFFFHFENLYDLIDKFYHLVQWKELQSAELHQFADVIFEFENSNGPDLALLNSFIERKKFNLSIQTPESENALRVMTIHRSKGLEFPVVILPDLVLSAGGHPKFMVQRGDKVLNTTLKKESAVAEIRQENEIETNLTNLDFLNLLYVGFTRPVDRLYVMSLDKRSGDIVKQFKNTIKNHFEFIELENGTIRVLIGEREQNLELHEEYKNNYVPNNISDQLWFPDIALLKKKGRDERLLSDERRLGNQFHFIMSEINSPNDFEVKLKQWILDGQIAEEFKATLCDLVARTFSNPSFKTIFDGVESVLSEQAIIVDEETSKRPDKVLLKANETIIIDYKTGVKSKKYEKQIRDYVQLFEQMNFRNVSGYLYYTETNSLEKISH